MPSLTLEAISSGVITIKVSLSVCLVSIALVYDCTVLSSYCDDGEGSNCGAFIRASVFMVEADALRRSPGGLRDDAVDVCAMPCGCTVGGDVWSTITAVVVVVVVAMTEPGWMGVGVASPI